MSASSSSAVKPASSSAGLTAEEQQRETEWLADPEMAFEEGVEIAFSRWEALNIAVNNLGGGDGNEKVEEFITTALEWFADEKDKICWDDVEGWLQEVLSEEFHIDAQDGSCEQMGRLMCTLYRDVYKLKDFSGLHKMIRNQSDVSRRLVEARRIGTTESDRHNKLAELEYETDASEEDGEEEEAAAGMAGLAVGSSSSSSAAAASAAPIPEPEPVEEKTAEQLQDEADGWETVPKKTGGKKGGKK